MAEPARRRGVLLVNLGTPASTGVRDVRRYLREFLGDPRVLDVPGPVRSFLLNAVILPRRPAQSAEAYRKIWLPEGSPLLVYGVALRDALQKELGEGFAVELAMRYGEPRIADAIERLVEADVERITAIPLFPQYAASSTGSAAESVLRAAGARWNVPPIEVWGAFHGDPRFVAALATVTGTALASFRADHVLFSFHGLPERQIRKSDPTGAHCLASEGCCDALGPANRYCYRAQSFATARALAEALSLAPGSWSVAFQSRLGRIPWIKPYTDEVLPELAARGVRRLAVACPSFVADCLETIEEIGIRARAQWAELGGSELRLAPCLNAHPAWVGALARMIRSPRPSRAD